MEIPAGVLARLLEAVLGFTCQVNADRMVVGLMAPAANMKNFSELLGQVPAGAWVAISQDGTRVISFCAELGVVIDQARAASEIEHMRGAGSGELSTEEILALTRA